MKPDKTLLNSKRVQVTALFLQNYANFQNGVDLENVLLHPFIFVFSLSNAVLLFISGRGLVLYCYLFQGILPTSPDYRSPCWSEPLSEIDPYPVRYHPYRKLLDRLKYGNNFKAAFQENIKLFQDRFNQTEQPWRLRCLPHVYLIGVLKSGTSNVYSTLLSNHQFIIGPPMKDPQYWNSFRTGGKLY